MILCLVGSCVGRLDLDEVCYFT